MPLNFFKASGIKNVEIKDNNKIKLFSSQKSILLNSDLTHIG